MYTTSISKCVCTVYRYWYSNTIYRCAERYMYMCRSRMRWWYMWPGRSSLAVHNRWVYTHVLPVLGNQPSLTVQCGWTAERLWQPLPSNVIPRSLLFNLNLVTIVHLHCMLALYTCTLCCTCTITSYPDLFDIDTASIRGYSSLCTFLY